ncbi:unnamed protein product, partial [Arabidopsis halleri]
MTTIDKQLSPKESDIRVMVAAEVHFGTKNCKYQMERYVFKQRNDGKIFSSGISVSVFVCRFTLLAVTTIMRVTIRPEQKWVVILLVNYEVLPQTDFAALEYGVVGGDQWIIAQIPDAAWPGEA